MMKTKDLTGAALDWAVARASEGYCNVFIRRNGLGQYHPWLGAPYGGFYYPSTDWSQGGPLIERYQVVYRHHIGFVEACCMTGEIGVNRKRNAIMQGATILEAACRSIVALKLGASVEVPEELL